MIQRRFFLMGASALALSGCGKDLIGPPEAGTIYVVRPHFPAAPAGGAKVPWALSILRPDVAGALDSDRIALRLTTEAAEIGTWDLDVLGDRLTWSTRTKAMFGISPEVPCDMREFYAGLHPDDRAATMAASILPGSSRASVRATVP